MSFLSPGKFSCNYFWKVVSFILFSGTLVRYFLDLIFLNIVLYIEDYFLHFLWACAAIWLSSLDLYSISISSFSTMSNLLSYLPHIIYACSFISRISTIVIFLLSCSDISVFLNSWLFFKILTWKTISIFFIMYSFQCVTFFYIYFYFLTLSSDLSPCVSRNLIVTSFSE